MATAWELRPLRRVLLVAQGTEDVSRNIAKVTAASSETGKVAGEVLTATAELSKQSHALREEVDQFMNHARSA